MLTCPVCQTTANDDQRFCAECGSRLPEPTPATTPPTEPPQDPETAPPADTLPSAGQTVLLPPEPDPAAAVGATIRIPPEMPAYTPPSPLPTDRLEPPPTASTIIIPPEQSGYTMPPPPPPMATPPPQSNNRRGLCMIFGIIGAVGVVACALIAAAVFYFGSTVAENIPNIPTIEVEPFEPTAPTESTDPTEESGTAEGEVLLEQDFDSEFGSIVTAGSSDVANYTFEDGTYAIQVNEPAYISWEPLPDSYRDVAIQVETTLSGPQDAAAALIFRMQDGDNFYIFNVSGDGQYNLEVYAGEEDPTTLVDWSTSSSINGPGDMNLLRVETTGDTIRLFVNGDLLEEVSDSTFIRGDVAIATNTFAEAGAKVNFDNLIITEMP